MFTMKFEGGAELARELNALPARLTKRIVMDALRDAAEPMRGRMAQLAPREPGSPDLAENIGISAASKIGSTLGGKWRSREEGEFAVAVGPTKDFFYGIFQEYGTTRHRAQPFMRPAFDGEAPKALGILGRALWTALAARGISRSVTLPATVQAPGGSGLL